ncbi:MAG TPA: hypothetical protein VFI77_09690 [Gemmatimonadales bacterium]|jgi:hypothetical protein|nr:hypothetical protein [Gemmatimonadales bacterium]
MWFRLPLFLALTAGLAGCRERSGALTPAQRERFAAEGIRHQADDLVFRYTDHPGRRDARWEDRLASIVVTGATVLVHKNEKVGVEITPRTRRWAAVERSGDRVRIRVGQGRSEELWSFVPPDDPARWVDDMRAVIHNSDSEANRP